jgi:hypothetical protein
MSILIKGIPLAGYEISIMKDGERYRARVDGIWCEVEEIPTTDTDSDTISRQAVKEILDKYQLRYHIYPYVWEAINALPPAQPTPDQNGDLWITVPDIDEVTCIYVQESKSKFCMIFYEEQEQSEPYKVVTT